MVTTTIQKDKQAARKRIIDSYKMSISKIQQIQYHQYYRRNQEIIKMEITISNLRRTTRVLLKERYPCGCSIRCFESAFNPIVVITSGDPITRENAF
jgi:hypothetical protein